MDRHVTLLGIVFIVSGALGIMIALFLFWVIAGSGIISGDTEAMAITTLIATALSGFFVILSIPEIIAGIGILKYNEWARILGLILAVLSLLEIPIGTIIGIYALWVLLKRETIQLFNPPSS